MKENKKKIIMVALSVLVCIMAVGYAVLAQQLNITGTTSIDSTWRVEITNIQEKEVVGDATSKVTPSYTATTANFNVGLTQPGDSITYDIEISNLGTLNAVLESINVTMDENEAIKYTTIGIKRGDKLGAGEKTTLTIKVEYDSSVTSQPSVTTKNITVTLNYQQDLGQVVVYSAYNVGDEITYNGMKFYVISPSDTTQDYVTLLKDELLTSEEVKVNGHTSSYLEGGVYYDDTDPYSSDYETSDIKKVVEAWSNAKLTQSDLEEVDGYKSRLLTHGELTANLGYEVKTEGNIYKSTNGETPSWVYNNNYWYWTMSPYNNSASYVWLMGSNGNLTSNLVYEYHGGGVRPVINLKKSAI